MRLFDFFFPHRGGRKAAEPSRSPSPDPIRLPAGEDAEPAPEPMAFGENESGPEWECAREDLEADPQATVEAGVMDELDRATEALFEQPDPVVHRVSWLGTTEAAGEDYDRAALRELFSGIASNHARPVKNLVFELRRGTAQKEWIGLSRPVMKALIDGARQTGLFDVAATMADFDAALSVAASGTDAIIDPAARDRILACWREMAEALPEAFRQDEEEQRREAIIIHSLLKQVPGVGHVTFVRLFEAGLTDLESLFLAIPVELAGTTSIPQPLCERICARIQDYRRNMQHARERLPEGERRAHLSRLVEELRQRHEGYEAACSADWNDPAHEEEKRQHRAERQSCALQIEVLLADLGEVALVEQIQTLPYGARIEALERFVVEMVV